MHAVACSASEKRPAMQASHALPLVIVPGLQVLQYPADAPPQSWRAPAAQASVTHSLHSDLPVAFWKEPTGQLSQLPPLAKRPVSHFVQKVWPPICCTEPAGHGLQLPWFFSVENVCSRQSWHVRSAVLLALVSTCDPGGQLRASANGDARDPPRQKYSGGHASHVPLVTLPKVPGAHETLHEVAFAALNALHSQRVQGSLLVPFLNWPAAQAVQAG